MPKKILNLLAAMVCMAGAFFASSEGPDLKEGLWQITVTLEVPDMSFKIPSQTFTQCLTKNDFIPYQKEETDQECVIKKYEVKGNTVTWVMECDDSEEKIIGNGKVTYRGTTFEGVITIKGQGEFITQKITGKWIGDCKK